MALFIEKQKQMNNFSVYFDDSKLPFGSESVAAKEIYSSNIQTIFSKTEFANCNFLQSKEYALSQWAFEDSDDLITQNQSTNSPSFFHYKGSSPILQYKNIDLSALISKFSLK